MAGSEKKVSIWRRWGWEVSTNTVAGVLSAAVIAAFLALGAFVQPLRHWLFSQVPLLGWGLVVIVLVAVFVGALISFMFCRKCSDTAPARGVFSSAAVSREPEPFEVGDLEERVLRLLRIADGKWADFSFMTKNLAVSSQQDLQQALSRLSGEGWIQEHEDNYVMKEQACRYRLADEGISYARKRGFKTAIEIEREGSKGV